ncbi:proline-, glutamic acid- and leucine-rich protein 1 isoform X2 [Brachypodium distachyon]|uniref:proline-, glutamic acid- and leucine-rich protein 1 isoform X2 n=1 Tax=Brachypodium distachyon TaxID=15368 RepID=UPI00052FF5E3|nr:proline-, glutamic acid- and leucine-rich protein 1 isoform X2 [Brachypodium distachyon]|eukprot:XP_010238087.1 proline-, glutamic acid- and leucine-rich protein 1 isoform X2 [Brachypodium distachyon]
MPRRRSTAGRMDAAIDHSIPMGYNKAQVRSVVNTLLKVYGTEDGNQPWALLEDNCYQVVQDALFEKQEEEEQQSEEEDVQEEGGAQEQQHEEFEEDDEAPQQEAAMHEAPLENNMTIVRVHSDLPSEAASAVEEKEEVVPMTIDAPAHRAVLPQPLPAVVATDGSVSPRVIRTMKNILVIGNMRRLSQLQEETGFATRSGQVDGM